MKVAQINNGQTNKNNDQIKTKEDNQRVVKFAPPRSIIVIEEPNETQSPIQDQPLKDKYAVQQSDQKILEQKTAEEIATATAVMNSITWQFQAGEKETKTIDPVIPSDQDVSLSEDALETAFAMLSNRATPASMNLFLKYHQNGHGVVRVGLLVPLSGKYAALGNEIRRSVEMALFTINNPKIELLFLDTKAGENAGSAAMTGIKSGVDIFIGPLFTDAVIEARAVMDDVDSQIP